jgi:hypothetical protein
MSSDSILPSIILNKDYTQLRLKDRFGKEKAPQVYYLRVTFTLCVEEADDTGLCQGRLCQQSQPKNTTWD